MRSVNGYFPHYVVPGVKKVRFEPYADNSGSVVAIAGDDYAVIGADTRLSTDFSIYTRKQKLFKLSDRIVLGATGGWCDAQTLTKPLKERMQLYEREHNKAMSTPAVAHMLSAMLYCEKFFPYYISNILAGLDTDGKGCVYSYDPIGQFERLNYGAGGSAGAQLQPLLDNKIGLKNIQDVQEVPLPQEKAVSLLKEVFINAAERDLYTGDCIYILIITSTGIQEEKFELPKD